MASISGAPDGFALLAEDVQLPDIHALAFQAIRERVERLFQTPERIDEPLGRAAKDVVVAPGLDNPGMQLDPAEGADASNFIMPTGRIVSTRGLDSYRMGSILGETRSCVRRFKMPYGRLRVRALQRTGSWAR